MQEEKLAERVGGVVFGVVGLALLVIGIVSWQILRVVQEPTQDQVVAMTPVSPQDLKVGADPMGGPSESTTGAGAGGSAAAGYEAGRVSGALAQPVKPPQPYGVTDSRMSPVGSDGSAAAERSTAIPADQPLVPQNAKGVTQPISTLPPPQIPVNVRQ